MKVKGRIPCGSSQERLFLLGGRAPRDQGTCCHPDTHLQVRQVTDTHRVRKRRAGSFKAQDLRLKKQTNKKTQHWLSIAQLIFIRCQLLPLIISSPFWGEVESAQRDTFPSLWQGMGKKGGKREMK